MIKSFPYLFVFLFSICISFTASAQDPSFNNSTLNIDVDSTNTDSTVVKRNTFKLIFSGEPGKAALYSLVLPSGGQIYNKKWWKVPLALGIDGWFTYRYLNHRKEFNKYDKIYRDYLMGKPNNEVTIQDAKTQRESNRQKKEYGLVYAIVGHLVTVFDAYVDRHLMDFDSSDDVSFTPIQNYDNTLTLISIRIPLN